MRLQTTTNFAHAGVRDKCGRVQLLGDPKGTVLPGRLALDR